MAWFTVQLLLLIAVAFVAGLVVGWLWWHYGRGTGTSSARTTQLERERDEAVAERDTLRAAAKDTDSEVERLRKAVAVRDEAMAEQRASRVDATRVRSEVAQRDRRIADLEAAASARVVDGGADLSNLLERLRERNDRVAMLEQQTAVGDATARSRLGELEAELAKREDRIAEQAARLRDLDERLAQRVEREQALRAQLAVHVEDADVVDLRRAGAKDEDPIRFLGGVDDLRAKEV